MNLYPGQQQVIAGLPRPAAPRPPRRGMPRWLTAILAGVVLGAGGLVAVAFVKSAPKAEKQERTPVVPAVEVATVGKGSRPISMVLQGEVTPSKSVVVMPEVAGKVVWQSDDLVPGGRFDKGEKMLRIDPRDLQLQLRQQRAQIASQKLALQMEKGRKKVAEKEWELFEEERKDAGLPPMAKDDAGRSLALRVPQVRSAQLQVGAAISSAEQTRLMLTRTTLTAPFNAVVQAESVDEGQYVSPGMQLITLVGTDRYWVKVTVPMSKLGYIVFPEDERAGSKARIWVEAGDHHVKRDGHVIRLLSDLDPVGRLARILVTVDDPMLVDDEATVVDSAEEGARGPKLPLLLGSFVQVEIEGVTLDGVSEVPRAALRENDQVFVLTGDSTLAIHEVEVLWGNEDHVLVTGPLSDGDKVVVSPLATPIDGMKLKTLPAEKTGKEARRE